MMLFQHYKTTASFFACSVLCMLVCTTSAARDMEEVVRKAAQITPSPEQLALQEMEFYAFIHFNLPTFLDNRECGTGKEDLALRAKARASDLRSTEGGLDYAHDASQTVDGDADTYWIVDEGTTSANLEYDLDKPRTFNMAVLQEFVRVGQRIEEFVLEIHDGRGWKEITRGTTVGYKRMLQFDDVTARRVRIRILKSRVCPTLSNFSLFQQPPIE